MAQKHPTVPVALQAAQELGSPCSTDLQGEDEEVVVPFAAAHRSIGGWLPWDVFSYLLFSNFIL